MKHFTAATSAIETALDAGRIGRPVAVRIVSASPDETRLTERHTSLLATAEHWLASPCDRLAALGSEGRGEIAALGRTGRGQIALVSAAICLGRTLMEILVVGTRGVLSWEPGGSPSPSRETPPLDDRALRLADAIRAATESGELVEYSADGRWLPRPAPNDEFVAPSPDAAVQAAPPLRPVPPPYGVLLVAGGHTHQENYARSFAADPRCRLVGVTDGSEITPRRRELNERLARELAIPYFDDYAAALRRDDVQIACICAEPERRAALIVQAAEAGKHLYLDKPLAATAAEGRAIAAAIRRAGVLGQMFSMVRGPLGVRLDAALRDRGLDDVRSLHCDLFFAKGHAGAVDIDVPRQETAEPRAFEGVESKREFYNVGVYPLVMAQRAFGRRVRRIAALTGNYFFEEHVRHGMEDFGAALCELDGGRLLTVMAGRTGWRSHPAGGVQRACLIGAGGALTIDAYRPRLEVWADEPAWTAPPRHPLDPMAFWSGTQAESGLRPKNAWLTPPEEFRDDAAYFLDCLQHGRPSDVSADLAADVLAAQLAAYRSAAGGSLVRLA